MINYVFQGLIFFLQEAGSTQPPGIKNAMLEGLKHPDLSKFLVVGALLFIIGVAGVLTRRNIIVIFMSIELILNAANLNFIAMSRYLEATGRANALAGQLFT